MQKNDSMSTFPGATYNCVYTNAQSPQRIFYEVLCVFSRAPVTLVCNLSDQMSRQKWQMLRVICGRWKAYSTLSDWGGKERWGSCHSVNKTGLFPAVKEGYTQNE